MVYYITSPAYQQTINTTIKEQNMLVGQALIDTHFQFLDYVKNNLTKFNVDMDTLVLELSAIDDSDENIVKALKMLRTLYENAKIIIVSSTRIPGDQLLAEIFALGILNIIATSDYLELKQELIVCLGEKGKSFKDALVFKDTKENIERVGKERLKVVSRVLIGITGSQSRVGVTHNTIILANHLRKLGFLVAVVERNNSGDFELIRTGHTEKLYDQSYFTMFGVDYYLKVIEKERMKHILEKNYNFILFDYGCLAQTDKAEFLKCHKKLVLVGSKTWELHYLGRIIKEYPEDILRQFSICFNLVNDSYKKPLKQSIKYPNGEPMDMFFFGYNPEPFKVGDFEAADEILEDYLLVPQKKAKESLFSKLTKKRRKG